MKPRAGHSTTARVLSKASRKPPHPTRRTGGLASHGGALAPLRREYFCVWLLLANVARWIERHFIQACAA
jgi:hypothetical protein